MWIRDRLHGLFRDEDFEGWFPSDGRPGLSAAVLALVCVLQFAENLTDRQAAIAVSCRIDWKYCLGMDLADTGFDYSVLSEFRDRMAEGERADTLLKVMVQRLVDAGLLKTRGKVRTDSTHVLAAVRTLGRPELVTETLRLALEALAETAPCWLAPLIDAGWARRYGRPARYDRLPKDKDELVEHVLRVGADGMLILRTLAEPGTPSSVKRLPQQEVLRRVWVQQYWTDEHGNLAWRGPKNTKDRLSRRDMPRRATGKPAADGRPDPGTVGERGDRHATRPRGPILPEAHRRRSARLDRLPRPPERVLRRRWRQRHRARGHRPGARAGHRRARAYSSGA